MKLQGVSVIFALIVLPLILVLTYYIQLQVNTIDKQNQYDVKLLNSAYGAMSAFEINTANEDLSSVSDALRTIIDASTNVFMNTLATNLGMSNASKSFVEPYIPAILYTLYDGYYISAPTRTPKILIDSDGNAVSLGDIGVTVVGGEIKFKQVHTSLESQTNCINCKSTKNEFGKVTKCEQGDELHVLYDNCDENHDENNEYAYMKPEKQAQYQVKYNQLSASQREAYGHLIYVKPKSNPANLEEEPKYTTNVSEAELEIKHMLKTYMPYSARYKNDAKKFDVTVIYTLDNYVTIEGTVGGVYYTKSGYLIPKTIPYSAYPTSVTIEEGPENLLSYNQNAAKEYIYEGNPITITVAGSILQSGGIARKSYATIEDEIIGLNTNLDLALSYIAQFSSMDETTKTEIDKDFVQKFSKPEYTNKFGNFSLNPGVSNLYQNLLKIKEQATKKINDRQYKLNQMSAVAYYVCAYNFSNWVYENFGSKTAPYAILEKDLVEISGQSYKLIDGKSDVLHKFSDSELVVFDIKGNDNIDLNDLNSPMEIDTDSPFYSHKLNIIRDSIQYNLNLSMSTYNKMLLSTNDYAMPVMQNEEWERILKNVSIVAYMQGYNCGLKTYSNYKIVSSTNNEISVSPREIFYVEKDNFSDEVTEYHRIDCPKLWELYKARRDEGKTCDYLSFISKEVKFDKSYDKANAILPYKYNHKNLACYVCINDGNYKKNHLFETLQNGRLRQAYHAAVGSARNNLYKMNAIEKSQGYEIITAGNESKYGLNQIKEIEIVLNTIKTRELEENVLNYKVSISGTMVNDDIYTIVPNVTTKSTVVINVDQDTVVDSKVSISNLEFLNLFNESTAYSDNAATEAKADFNERNKQIVRDSIEFIRVIYR